MYELRSDHSAQTQFLHQWTKGKISYTAEVDVDIFDTESPSRDDNPCMEQFGNVIDKQKDQQQLLKFCQLHNCSGYCMRKEKSASTAGKKKEKEKDDDDDDSDLIPARFLIVDQFEELFTLASHPDHSYAHGRALIDNLLYASSIAGGRAVVLLTLRADFMGQALARGIRLAVVSMSYEAQVNALLSRHLPALYPHFQPILGKESGPKTAPESPLYRRCLAELGTAVERTLVIEDSEDGFRAARRAGSTPNTRPVIMATPTAVKGAHSGAAMGNAGNSFCRTAIPR